MLSTDKERLTEEDKSPSSIKGHSEFSLKIFINKIWRKNCFIFLSRAFFLILFLAYVRCYHTFSYSFLLSHCFTAFANFLNIKHTSHTLSPFGILSQLLSNIFILFQLLAHFRSFFAYM